MSFLLVMICYVKLYWARSNRKNKIEKKNKKLKIYSIAVFCLQNLICLLFLFADQVFIDPAFFGIFVCGPLQSFVVNVCTNIKN